MTVAFDESAYLFPLVERHIVHYQDGTRDVPLSKHRKQLLKKRTEELPVEGSCLCRVVEYLLTIHGAADGDVPRPQSWRHLHGSSPLQRPPLSCLHRDAESNFIDEVDLGLRNLRKELQERSQKSQSRITKNELITLSVISYQSIYRKVSA